MKKKRKAFYQREGSCPDAPHCTLIDGEKYCMFGLIENCMYQEYEPDASDPQKKYRCTCDRKCKHGRNVEA